MVEQPEGSESSALPPVAIHGLHEELERLLAGGQATVIALRLQMRFLQVVLASDRSVWLAWGFPIALSFAERVPAQLPHGLSPEDLDEMESVLRRCAERPVPPWTDGSRWREASTRAIGFLGEARVELERSLSGVSALPDAVPLSGEAAVWVPVVAEPIGADADHPLTRGLKAGLLLRLHVRAQIVQRDASAPELTVDGTLADDGRIALEQALRTLSRIPMPGAPTAGRTWFRVSWDLSGARIVGRSASLGFLLGAMTARSGLAAGIIARTISPFLALTGDLEGTQVTEVDAGSLAWKVRACFFGPAGVLVVPWDQREAALAEVRKLEASYPSRQLVVHGIRDFSEIWGNPILVGTRSRGVSEFLQVGLRRLAASRAFTLSLLLVLALLAGFAAKEAWVSRKIPATVEWEGENLVVRNAYGRVCFRRPLPPGWPPGEPTRSSAIGDRLVVCDLDGRTGKEILATVWRGTDGSNDLVAFSGNGTQLWHLPGPDVVPGGEWRFEIRWWFFCRTDRTAERGASIIGVRRSTMHAGTVIDRLESATGARRGMLRNHGHLEVAVLVDLEHDGVQEIGLAGTHNPTGTGIFLVLDPERMTLDPSWREPADILNTGDPRALGAGLLAAFRVPADRFGPPGRPHCSFGCTDEGALMISVQGQEHRQQLLFYLDTREPRSPLALRAVLCDPYRDFLTAKGWTREELAMEEERLAGEVVHLTPDGWKPVPRAP